MAYTFEHCREQMSISIEPNYIFKHVFLCDNYMDTKHLSKYLKLSTRMHGLPLVTRVYECKLMVLTRH